MDGEGGGEGGDEWCIVISVALGGSILIKVRVVGEKGIVCLQRLFLDSNGDGLGICPGYLGPILTYGGIW